MLYYSRIIVGGKELIRMTAAATQRVLTVMQGVPDEYENELVSMVVDFKLL